MPVFTYVAAVLVAEVGGIMLAAAIGSAGIAFVTSAIALGLAITTARVLGLTGGDGGTRQDPGVRIQFPPGTTNKVPVVYGHANTKGIVTDARISNENKTMTYVLTISEKTQSGAFTIGNIYWNDQLLVFRTAAESHIVASSIDQNGNGASNTNYNGLMRFRVYSGGSLAANQIFPTSGTPVDAYSLLAGSETETTYQMSDLLFAVVQLDYSSEKGTTGLGQLTFEVTNSLDNPGLVWWDYMTSNRYGAGIGSGQIDGGSSTSTTTATSIYSISNQIPENQYTPISYFLGSISGTVLTVTTASGASPVVGTIAVGQRLFGTVTTGTVITSLGSGTGGEGTYNINLSQTRASDYLRGSTTSTQDRYQVNGVISTGDTVKNNLDKISIACESWTSFDYSEGKWKLVSNRAATAGELTTAFVFNDDNILGEVGITSTNLEDLYNNLEVEFASRKIRDQNDYYKAAIDTSARNYLEPDNKLSIRLELVNNALQSGRIGLIELKQSRTDLIITFNADYSALQCEAGDVVKVNNEVYGFTDKLFRISKLREVEDEVGGLTVEVTALEYDSTVYTDEVLEDSADTPGSGIPTFGGSASLPAPSKPIVSTISTTTPSFQLQTTINLTSSAVDEVQWWYSTTSTSGFAYLANEYSASGTFAAGSTVTDIVSIPQQGTFYFQARAGLGARYSNFSTATTVGFYWNPNDYGGI